MEYNQELIIDNINEMRCPIHSAHPSNLAFRGGEIYVDCCCPDFNLLVKKEMTHQVEMQELIYNILSRSGLREEVVVKTEEEN